MVKLMSILFALSTFLLPVPDWEPAAEDVVAGYLAGISAVALTVVAVIQSVLLWPVLVCGGVAAGVLWRCRG